MAQQDSWNDGAPGASDRSRVPPNQRVTDKFYTLTAEDIPSVDTTSFVFRFWGTVRKPVEVTWQELMALPRVEREADFHCVTGWSMLGTTWGGIVVRDLLAAVHVEPAPEARFVMAHSVTDYTTNLPLEDLLAADTMLAWEWQGAPLPAEHGGPLRLLVPSLYAWKDAKWVNGLEFMTEDRPGFWEERGYHMHGDPWKEERYG
ncbi:MAG TPA: sulfite oxidase-like oxidoreductase [Candidatus Cryosericum sp.]|nr:sulfite oxidase-like oxidoreductase [Candidatus Cryosericum sp.]